MEQQRNRLFDCCRTIRKDNDTVGKRDRFRQVVRDQKCRFSFIPDDLSDVIANLKPRLIVQGRKRFIQKKKLRLQDECADQAARCRIPPDNSEGLAFLKSPSP